MAVTRKKISKKKTVATKKRATQKTSAARKIVLDTHVRISGAPALKELLAGFLDRKQITIDASKTEKIDTSALQLLTAFVIEAEKHSIKLKWQDPAPCIINSARLLGLTEYLKLPPDPGKQ